MAEQTTSRRAAFSASSFANLRAAMGEGTGEPLRIALVDIDEDLEQPRRAFDQAELESLAHTVRGHGVLQPVGVMPPVDGRYRLVFGARRVRAAKLAGLSDIPAVIAAAGQRDLATQVIENQQRSGLANSELAAAIERLLAEGKRSSDIAAICNLKDYQVTAFRAVSKLPEFLRACLDASDMRAVYDLYRAWQKHPDAVQARVAELGAAISVTDARRLSEALSGQPTGSLVLERGRSAPAGANAVDPLSPTGTGDARDHETHRPAVGANGQTGRKSVDVQTEATCSTAPEGELDQQPDNQTQSPTRVFTGNAEQPVHVDADRRTGVPAFVVEWDGRQGLLVTSSLPMAAGHVFLDIDGTRVAAPCAGLRLVDAR